MRAFRTFLAVMLTAIYGVVYWLNSPVREQTERNLALQQVQDSNAAYQSLATWQQMLPVGWIVVALIVLVLLFPEIRRACRKLNEASSY